MASAAVATKPVLARLNGAAKIGVAGPLTARNAELNSLVSPDWASLAVMFSLHPGSVWNPQFSPWA